MRETPFFTWTYPDENEDPYDENLTSFFSQIDDGVFGLLNTAGNIIIPPSFVGWDPINLILTWNNHFEFPLMSIAFSFFVEFGPDGLTKQANMSDGARLVVTVPRIASENVSGNFRVVTSSMAIDNGLFTVGFCRGTRFYANFPQIL